MAAACSPYEPLPSPRSIRLLSVAIFEKSNVYLHIHTADLDDEAIDFDALSYTWGSPIDTPSALEEYGPNNDVEVVLVSTLGKFSLKIGRNLYEAVLDLSRRRPRALWIDAVCINQTDVDEKAQQVAIMGDIYSKASKTIVWMGIDDKTMPIFHHIRYIHGEFYDELKDAVEDHIDGPIAWEDFEDPASDLVFRLKARTLRLSRQAVDALYSFYLTRRYLRRVWVVQEVYHGDAVAILDGHFFNFCRFSAMAGLLAGSGTVRLTYASAGKHALGVDLSTMDAEVIDMLATRDADAVHGYNQQKRADNTTLAYFEIMIRLLQLSMKEATDSRDYLFAFHSIAKSLSGAEGFAPDYRLSSEQVYYAFTCEALKHTLEVLTLAEGSWVPDYANPIASALAVAPFLDLCAGGSYQPVTIGEDQTLLVAAQRYSTVAQAFQFAGTVEAGALNNCAIARGAYDTFLQALHFLQDCSLSDTEDLFRVLTMKLEEAPLEFRAHISDMTKLLVLDLVAAEDHEAVDHLLDLLSSFDHVPDVSVLSEMREMLTDWLSDKSRVDRESLSPDILQVMDNQSSIPQFLLYGDEVFFMTEDGRFGRTAAGAEQQDEIWLLRGARAPWVLRKKGEKTYALVAEAVVPGVMFGEKTVDGMLSPTETIGILR